MADPNFPDVPLMAGVPPVNRHEPFHQAPVDKLTKDADGISKGKGATVAWGIFGQKGGLAIKPDSIAAFEFQQEYRVAEYPLEEGGFESYNKVTLPFDARVIMTKGGSLAERKAFLETVDAVVASLDLYTIVTPERSYGNANLTRMGFRREAESGVSLLTVELHAVEIRTQASVQFVASAPGDQSGGNRNPGDTHAPSGANPRSNGSVQPVTPPRLPPGHPDEAPAFRPAPSFVE